MFNQSAISSLPISQQLNIINTALFNELFLTYTPIVSLLTNNIKKYDIKSRNTRMIGMQLKIDEEDFNDTSGYTYLRHNTEAQTFGVKTEAYSFNQQYKMLTYPIDIKHFNNDEILNPILKQALRRLVIAYDLELFLDTVNPSFLNQANTTKKGDLTVNNSNEFLNALTANIISSYTKFGTKPSVFIGHELVSRLQSELFGLETLWERIKKYEMIENISIINPLIVNQLTLMKNNQTTANHILIVNRNHLCLHEGAQPSVDYVFEEGRKRSYDLGYDSPYLQVTAKEAVITQKITFK